MSHYSTIKVKIDDIEAVRDACEELGLTLKGKGKVRFYYSHNQIEADYVISIPGCPYDVGLVKDMSGEYSLVYDKFGNHVEKVLGENCHKLVQAAVYHKVKRQAKMRGFFVQKKVNDKGNLVVTLTK